MMTPERFDELLLDYAYDLLDETQSQEIREFLAQHPEAQARLSKMRELLELAAKQSFPDVHFRPPTVDGATVAPSSLEKVAASRPGLWVRWLVAAVILVGVLVGAGPLLRLGLRYYEADQAYHASAQKRDAILDERKAVTAPIQREQTALLERSAKIQSEIQKLSTEQQERLRSLEEEIANQSLILEVSGPEAIQPGAPNHFQIATLGRAQRNPVSAKLHIRVLGEEQRVLYEEKDVVSQGVYTLHLPPDLPVKLHTPIALDITASGQGQVRGELSERLSWAAPRYVTHLATDKPLYQPGQTVYYRSLTLNRATLQPPEEDFHLVFTLTNPAGAEIHRLEGSSQLVKLANDSEAKKLFGPDQKPIRGVGVGEFTLPEDSEGGEYVLTVSEARNRFPPEKRRVLVNRYTPDRLEKELNFHRSTYGPGDEVIVQCKVRRAGDNGPVAGIEVASAMAQIDEHGIAAVPLGPIDAAGRVSLRLEIPKRLELGRGALTVTFTDGGAVESIQKPIPILLKKVFVDFFPESGELVADVPNRVYFQARTTLDRPAQIRGRLLNSKNELVATVETLSDDAEPGANQGLGVFRFVPNAEEKYFLRIDSPGGIEEAIPLLSERIQIRTDTVAMSCPEGVTSEPQPLLVELHTVKRARQILVGAYCRGVLLEHQRVRVEPGKPSRVELKLPESVGGVVRVTAFEEQAGGSGRAVLIPRAERLVYRRSAKKLNIAIDPDRRRYTPGDKATVTVRVTDERGQPARAISLISVVDQTVVTMADDKTDRSLPTHFALVGEVKKPEDLEYADFFFADHPKAATLLDLLLGVQGWRRFAEQSPEQFRRQEGEEAERILVLSGQAGQRVFNSIEDKRAEIQREFEPKFASLREELSKITLRLERLQEQEQAIQPRLIEIEERQAQAQAELAAAGQVLDEHRSQLRQAGKFLLTVTGGIIILAAIFATVFGLIRGGVHRPVWIAVGVFALLLGIVVVGTRGFLDWTEDRSATVTAQVDRPMARMGAAPERFDAPAGLPADAAQMARPEMGIAEAKMAGQPALLDEGAAGRGGHRKPGDAGLMMMRRGAAAPQGARRPAAVAPRGFLGAGRGMEVADKGRAVPLAGGLPRAAKDRAIARNQAEFGKQDMMFAPRAAGRPALPGGPIPPGAGGAMEFMPGIVPPPLADPAPLPPAPEPLVVREYAHVRLETQTGPRVDFAETLYWNPVALPDADGRAIARFHLSDSITSFRILVAAHTVDGRLGQSVLRIEARKPFAVETKLPSEMSNNDRLDLPIQIRNDSEGDRAAVVTVATEAFQLNGQTNQREFSDRLILSPNQSVRRLLSLQPSVAEGSGVVKVHGSSEPFSADTVERRIRIVPNGFPVVESVSDAFAPGEGPKVVLRDFELPADYVAGTLRLFARLYPSPLADLQQGLESMLQEPMGCFEQSSSGNYPNTLIMSYLKERGEPNAAALQRAAELLERGYERLISFECRKQTGGREGYEWFGGDAPPHEALTAYGLLQFNDMARVFPVDHEMLARTRRYLLSRRRPEGGFLRNERALDTFGRAPQHITDAYIVWSLSATGDEDLSKDIDKLLQEPAGKNDPYFLALLANALVQRGQKDRATDLLRRVRQMQAADGGIDGAQTSITSSGGRDLRIETTALAILAWLRVDRPEEFHEPTTRAVRWITQQRGGYGGFGATQATILALKALLEYTKASKRISDDGELKLFAGDRLLGQVRFLADRTEPVTLEIDSNDDLIKPGKNALRLELHSKAGIPFSLAWSYYRRLPPSSDKCPLRLRVSLDRKEVQEGDGVRLQTRLENVSGKGLPMTVAILGLPAGLRVPEDMRQLREMARLRRGDGDQMLPGEISFFEIRGRDLVLYWRDLKPDAVIDLNIDLRADHPGEFRGPASRAYLYYDAEHKNWVEPIAIRIMPKSP